MKQMRTRFRLITLLLACGFLLTLALCAGTVLKTAGITLPSLSSVSSTPDPLPSAAAPSLSPVPSGTPGPSDSALPENDSTPVPEYNIFGL